VIRLLLVVAQMKLGREGADEWTLCSAAAAALDSLKFPDFP
jgi:hypothetical protein